MPTGRTRFGRTDLDDGDVDDGDVDDGEPSEDDLDDFGNEEPDDVAVGDIDEDPS
ncbi:MAG: hypothetical protein V9F03_13930 [Microthrixaceae bacterium]